MDKQDTDKLTDFSDYEEVNEYLQEEQQEIIIKDEPKQSSFEEFKIKYRPVIENVILPILFFILAISALTIETYYFFTQH